MPHFFYNRFSSNAGYRVRVSRLYLDKMPKHFKTKLCYVYPLSRLCGHFFPNRHSILLVWSLIQFYSVGFLQSRISVKSVFFTDTQSRLVPSAVIDSALRLPRLALHTMWCPFNSRVSEAMDEARLRALEGRSVRSKGPFSGSNCLETNWIAEQKRNTEESNIIFDDEEDSIF